MNVVLLSGLLVAILQIPVLQCSNFGGHPQARFCWAQFVIRVKILSKIKKYDSASSSQVTHTAFPKSMVDSLKTQQSNAQRNEDEASAEGPSLRQIENIYHKGRDLPPGEDTAGDSSFKGTSSGLDVILGRHKRSLDIRLRGVPSHVRNYRPAGLDRGMMYYDVLIKKIFKGEDKVRNIDGAFVDAAKPKRLFARVYVGFNTAQNLEPGEAYMLSGRIMRNSLVVSSNFCWYEKWKNLSKVQKHGLNGKYAENCDCKITQCYTEEQCKAMVIFKKCLLYFRDECGVSHRTCVKQNNVCSWEESKEFDICSNQQPNLP